MTLYIEKLADKWREPVNCCDCGRTLGLSESRWRIGGRIDYNGWWVAQRCEQCQIVWATLGALGVEICDDEGFQYDLGESLNALPGPIAGLFSPHFVQGPLFGWLAVDSPSLFEDERISGGVWTPDAVETWADDGLRLRDLAVEMFEGF